MFNIIFAIVICYVFYLLYKRQISRNYICECLKDFHGPPPKPFIGNVLDLGLNSVDVLKNITNIQNIYGPITKLFVGPNRVYLIVTDPDLIAILLDSPVHIKKGVDYKFLRPWLMNGLILATGKYWQKRRKIITPAFHFKILDDFIPIFNSRGNILVEELLKTVGKVIDINPYITAFTLDSICETAMGTTVDAQTTPNHPYVKAVQTMCKLYISRKFSFWKSNDFLYSFTNDYKIQTKTLKTLHNFTKSIIEQRRKNYEKNTENKIQVEDEFGRKLRTAFLDLLLKTSGNILNDDDILEEVETFMFAGHDTTASAITFALLEIAKHPKIQDKIVDELKDIFGTDVCRHPTMQDLNNMIYLELVIKETLRFYSVVPMTSRELEEDLKYKNTIIPKGVTVTVFNYGLHKDPKLFKNPEIFNPERFLSNNIDNKYHFAYIPFNAGPRNCIGRKFAMLEMKAVLSKILRNFELLAADSYAPILAAEVILKSKNGVSMRLEKRSF